MSAEDDRQYFQKAAEQGDANAQYELGRLYFFGQGVPKDSAKAVEWFQKAGGQGNMEAREFYFMALAETPADNPYRQLDAGLKFYGAGNYAEAAEWFQKAAEQGQADAQALLGSMYDTGQGVPHDSVKAYELMRKAAAQGVPEAQEFLANKGRV